MTSWLDS